MTGSRVLSRRSALKAGLALLALPPAGRVVARPAIAAAPSPLDLLGKVNDRDFMGMGAGSLLFEGWERDVPAGARGGRTFVDRYHLAYRPPAWGLVPHPARDRYELVRMVDSRGRPLFPAADFRPLFERGGRYEIVVRPVPTPLWIWPAGPG